jgi:hypothetical protein
VKNSENVHLRIAMEAMGASFGVSADSSHVVAGMLVGVATVLVETGHDEDEAAELLTHAMAAVAKVPPGARHEAMISVLRAGAFLRAKTYVDEVAQ